MGFFKLAQKILIKAVPVGIIPEFMTHTAYWSKFNSKAAIDEGYKGVAWVYACVKKRADAVASVPLCVEVKTADGWEKDINHPLQELLDYPNPDISKNDLMKMIVTHLDLTGNSYLLKNRAGNKKVPVELWPLLPHYTNVIPGKERLIKEYEYTLNGNTRFSAEDVIHLAYIDPSCLYTGMSPLEAAAKAVDIDNAAQDFQKISMQNRGVPDGVLSFDAELTPEEWAQAKKQVDDQYSGTNNARRLFVLSKAKFIQMGQTLAEMDFMQTRGFTMEQICAVYGVPQELINKMGEANRASGENVRKGFYLDTVSSLLSDIQADLNMCLVPEFGDIRKLRIRFDTSAVPALQENYTEKVNNAKGLWSIGVPLNEVNKRLELGFDEIEGGDIGYIPSGVIPSNFDMEIEPQLSPDQAAAEAYGNETPDE